MIESITQEQARRFTTHDFIWCARLRSREVIWEQPGVSSDHLPVDEVVGIDYVPTRAGLPTIETNVDVGRGERFVRYWSNVWSPSTGKQMLYIGGVQSAGRHALYCFYPRHGKLVFATTRPFQPPRVPDAFCRLPDNAVRVGGQGHQYFGWHVDGFGGLIEIRDGRLSFRGLYV